MGGIEGYATQDTVTIRIFSRTPDLYERDSDTDKNTTWMLGMRYVIEGLNAQLGSTPGAALWRGSASPLDSPGFLHHGQGNGCIGALCLYIITLFMVQKPENLKTAPAIARGVGNPGPLFRLPSIA